MDGGSPTIRQCTFQYNALGFGSSARLENCNSVFENCVIKDAYSCNCGSGGRTSGVICLSGSNVTFTDCDFQNHYYVSSQGQGRGAALSIDFGCNSTLIRCRFVGNQTGNFYPNGGGTAYGAAVFAAGSVVAENCQFLDNFAHAGAGLTAWSDATITNCLFARNRAVSHPEGNGSIGNDGAGPLTLAYQSSHNIVVTNCTFVDNNCNKGAGAAFYGASDAQVRNCIFYHNYADSASPGEDPIWILKQQIVGNYDLTNCCVEGLLQTEPNEDPPPAANFPSCFDMPPLLVNVAGQNYRQQAISPCIGSGDSSFVPSGIATDLDGAPRITGAVDIGCYEFSGNAVASLVSTNLVEDQQGAYSVHSALSGELVFFLYSLVGTGPGPRLPGSNTICIQLLPSIIIGAAVVANTDGRAIHSVSVPMGMPPIDVWAQAVMLRGAGLANSVMTNVIHQTVQPKP